MALKLESEQTDKHTHTDLTEITTYPGNKDVKKTDQVRLFNVRILHNKKVLLRECKRYTAHCIVSTCCAAVSQMGVPTLAGGYLPWPGGTYPGWGYLPRLGIPSLAGDTYPGQGVTTLTWGTYPN